MKTVVLFDTNDESHECLLLNDGLKLYEENKMLKSKLQEISAVCMWDKPAGALERIYKLTKEYLWL